MRCRKSTGMSLIDTMVSMVVVSLLFGLIATTMVTTQKLFGKVQAVGDVTSVAQRTADEIAYQIRSADRILSSSTLNGNQITTGASNVVFSMPTATTTGGGDISKTAWDTAAFQHNAQSKIITESSVPMTGSIRPSRTSMVIGRNVKSLMMTYYVRDRFTKSGLSYDLSAIPLGIPKLYVDGTLSAVTFTISGQTLTLATLPTGTKLQFLYSVNPEDVAALTFVSYVDVTLQVETTYNGTSKQTATVNATARLRNYRE